MQYEHVRKQDIMCIPTKSASAWMKSASKDKKPKKECVDNRGKKPCKPKCQLMSDELGCTLLISLPPVIPEVQNLIAHQTIQFVLNFMIELNHCLVPEDRFDMAEVIIDSMQE